MSSMQVVGALLGGLGLFLLAVGMMSEGLRDAAGASLRKLLSEWTRTPLRGVFSGMLMTGVVQSSSAVTVAAIGFVNAGLLNLRQTLGVIYGANIGTTLTGWLVALVGFKLNIQACALPLIGIGMMIRLLIKEGRWPAFGLALVGFGLFFIGIDVLKGAFEGLVATFDISTLTAEGAWQTAVYLLAGIVMTVLTQSSSASIALTITAAASGMVGLHAAAAMVIGANVGTTSTAALAAIGATANAKRVALAQVLFNLGTGIVALMILPGMFWLIRSISNAAGLSTEPAVALALFHTVFNVLGVALVLPLNDRLARFLDGRFLRREEKSHLPRFLDKAVVGTPVLAINALVLELEALAERVRKVSWQGIEHRTLTPSLREEVAAIRDVSRAISQFIVQLERRALTPDISRHLALLLRIDQYLIASISHSEGALQQREALLNADQPELVLPWQRFEAASLHYLQADEPRELQEALSHMQSEHDQVKSQVLQAAAVQQISIEQMMTFLEILAEQLRCVQQWLKARHYLELVKVQSCTVSAEEEANPPAQNLAGPDVEQSPK